MGLKTNEKTDFGKTQFFYMMQGKISPQNPKKLTEKLTKSRFDATRSSEGYEKRASLHKASPSQIQNTLQLIS